MNTYSKLINNEGGVMNDLYCQYGHTLYRKQCVLRTIQNL